MLRKSKYLNMSKLQLFNMSILLPKKKNPNTMIPNNRNSAKLNGTFLAFL